MKSVVALVGVGSVALGMIAVFVFRGAPVPRVKPPTDVAVTRDDGGQPQRIALGSVTKGGALESSAKIDPQWAKLNRQAIDELEAGHNAAAAQLFRRCVAGVPGENVFQQNLAEALARLGNQEWDEGTDEGRTRGIEHLVEAAKVAPAREDIARRAEQLQRLAKSEEGMWRESSEHFELSYDGSREELLWKSHEITNVLETAYQELGDLFGFFPVEKGRPRLRVILYQKDSFHAATGIGHWAGGLYDGTIRTPVEDLGREKDVLTRVLRHELVHAFVHESGGRNVPGWLNEGLAQIYEPPTVLEQGRVATYAKKELEKHELLPLADLEKNLGELGEDEKIRRAYLEALVFVSWIIEQYGERVPFEMVAGCKDKDGARAAFARRTGSELGAAFDSFAARR